MCFIELVGSPRSPNLRCGVKCGEAQGLSVRLQVCLLSLVAGRSHHSALCIAETKAALPSLRAAWLLLLLRGVRRPVCVGRVIIDGAWHVAERCGTSDLR